METRRNKAWIPKLLLGMLLCLTCLWMSGCGTDDIDISGYADQKITLTGIGEKEVQLTIQELKEMDCITKKTESTSDKIGVVRATGPTLDTVLRQFGTSQSEVKRIHIYASDDYDIKLPREALGDSDVILAFGLDGKPLDSESAPLRIIVPESSGPL